MKKWKRLNIGLLLLGLVVLAVITVIVAEGQSIRGQKNELRESLNTFRMLYASEVLPPMNLRTDEFTAELGDYEAFVEDADVQAAFENAERVLEPYFPDEGIHWEVAGDRLLQSWYDYSSTIGQGITTPDGLTKQDLQSLELTFDTESDGYYGSMPPITLTEGEAWVSSFMFIETSKTSRYLDYTFQWILTPNGWRFNSVNFPAVEAIIEGMIW